jgi:hypothetical protein
MSDMHGDPFYATTQQQCGQNTSITRGNTFGTMGCDPPYALMESAVEAAARLEGAEFLLFTGDFTRHDQSNLPDAYSTVTQIIANMSDVIAKGFPQLLQAGQLCVGALGNDCSVMDYELDITTEEARNPWLQNVAGNALVATSVMSEEVSERYSYGGYFEERFGGLTVLSLDTIIYSVNHVPDTDDLPQDPFGQFAWLRARLQAAAREQRSVWIVGHIPPGLSTYSFSENWHQQYLLSYLSIVEDPELGSFVAAQLFGHVHMAEIRALPHAPPRAGPMLTSPALSPIFHNNPAFTVVEYDPSSGRMVNYKIYFAELSSGSQPLTWKLGFDAAASYEAVRKALASPGFLTNAAMQELGWELARGGSEWNTYAECYSSRVPNDLMHAGVHPLISSKLTLQAQMAYPEHYRCGTIVSTQAEFNECANITNPRLHLAAPAKSASDHEAARALAWRACGLQSLLWAGGGYQ